MPNPDYIDPSFGIPAAIILWAIYLFGPKVKRYIDAKKLDNTWKTNQF